MTIILAAIRPAIGVNIIPFVHPLGYDGCSMVCYNDPPPYRICVRALRTYAHRLSIPIRSPWFGTTEWVPTITPKIKNWDGDR